MRTWLSAAVAAGVLIFAMAGVASAAPGFPHGNGNSKGKGSLPPIDMSNAANCDFIAEPGRALPTPVPRRLLHAARHHQPDRAPGRPPYRGHAGERRRGPHRPDPLQRRRRLQPWRDDPRSRSRDSTPPRRPRDRRGADQPHRPLPATPNPPVVVIDASTGKRWPIWVEIDSNADARRDGARDPSGGELRLRPPLRRRAAQPEERRRRRHRGAGGFRYYRDKCPRSRTRSTRGAPTSSDLQDAAKAGIRRTTSTWPGTSPSPATRTLPAASSHARRRIRPLGDTDLADRPVRAARPRSRSPGRQRTEAQDPRSRAASTAPITVPCYLFPSCAPGGSFALDSNGNPTRTASGPPTSTASSRARRPTGRAGTGTAVALRPRPLRNRARGRAESSSELAQDHDFVFCATDEIGMSESDVADRLGILHEPLELPARSPTASSRACSTRSSSAAAMISPTGFTADPAFHADGTLGTGSVIDTSRPLLQRLQPGRDHGRRADRRDAGLHPGVAQRPGDELLGPAAALGRLRRVRAVLNPYTDELSRPLLLSPDPDALGPGRAERLRAPDDDQPAARHARAPGADERRLRRPPGDQLPGGRRGADDRRPAHPPVFDPGRWPDNDILWNVPRDPQLPVRRLGDLSTGTSGPTRERARRRPTSGPDRRPREHAQPRGEDPHGAPRGRRPSCSSSRTSSTARSRKATIAAAGPVSRSGSAGPS